VLATALLISSIDGCKNYFYDMFIEDFFTMKKPNSAPFDLKVGNKL
jgi:hypothetical protein